eukprot:364007-Chlamydomonas_euryale.AAC.1
MPHAWRWWSLWRGGEKGAGGRGEVEGCGDRDGGKGEEGRLARCEARDVGSTVEEFWRESKWEAKVSATALSPNTRPSEVLIEEMEKVGEQEVRMRKAFWTRL